MCFVRKKEGKECFPSKKKRKLSVIKIPLVFLTPSTFFMFSSILHHFVQYKMKKERKEEKKKREF